MEPPPPPPPPSHGHHSQQPSDGSTPPGRKRVGFSQGISPLDDGSASLSRSPDHAHVSARDSTGSTGHNTPVALRSDVSHEELSEEIHKAFGQPYVPKPRPAMRKVSRTPPQFQLCVDDVDDNENTKRSGLEARQRAAKLSKSVGTYSASAPGSRRSSNDMLTVSRRVDIRHPSAPEVPEDTSDDDSDTQRRVPRKDLAKEANRILRLNPEDLYHACATPMLSGQVTPTLEWDMETEHIPRPSKYRTGVLGTLLMANAASHHEFHGRGANLAWFDGNMSSASTAANSPLTSPPVSGSVTPDPERGNSQHWYSRTANSFLGKASKMKRPGVGKRTSSKESILSWHKEKNHNKEKKSRVIPADTKIKLAKTIKCYDYLQKLSAALMAFGAPSHRLEECMEMSARALKIKASFLYIPGYMIITFGDPTFHASEVKVVRAKSTTGDVNFAKFCYTHEIYKDVVRGKLLIPDAVRYLNYLLADKKRDEECDTLRSKEGDEESDKQCAKQGDHVYCPNEYGVWTVIFFCGVAAASVGPFAFQARPIDLPFCFLLGCLQGFIKHVTRKNEHLRNVSEISTAVATSFVARGLGSIRGQNGDELFCFSAMAQSSIALILPGFLVLNASLELQCRKLVAGSVRMVYAIIYLLFLGFGMAIGMVLFGMMYKDATSSTSCRKPMDSRWYYLFVIGFTIALAVVNQATYKQMPAMLAISLIGYAVNFNTAQVMKSNIQVSNTLGALAISVSANIHGLFSRRIERWWLLLWEERLSRHWNRLPKPWKQNRQDPVLPQSHAHNPVQEDYFSLGPNQPSRQGPNFHSAASTPDQQPKTPDQPAKGRPFKVGYGLAAATMLPAIFVQVPSGLAVNGTLVSGVQSANQIVHNTTGVTTVTSAEKASGSVNSLALTMAVSVIQVAIGISVGLALANLLVYPLRGLRGHKKRSGLFSF